MGGLVFGRGGVCGVAVLVALDGDGRHCSGMCVGVSLQAFKAIAVVAFGYGIWLVAFSGRIGCTDSH